MSIETSKKGYISFRLLKKGGVKKLEHYGTPRDREGIEIIQEEYEKHVLRIKPKLSARKSTDFGSKELGSMRKSQSLASLKSQVVTDRHNYKLPKIRQRFNEDTLSCYSKASVYMQIMLQQNILYYNYKNRYENEKITPLQKDLQHLEEVPQLENISETKEINNKSKQYIKHKIKEKSEKSVKIGSDFETKSRMTSIKDEISSICSSHRYRKANNNPREIKTKKKNRKSKSIVIEQISEHPELEKIDEDNNDIKDEKNQPNEDDNNINNEEIKDDSQLDTDLIDSSTTAINTELEFYENEYSNQSETTKQSYSSYLKKLIMKERKMRRKLEEEFENLKKIKIEIEEKIAQQN